MVRAVTVISKSRLAWARVLADSLERHHPEVPLTVVLADDVQGRFDPATEPFEVVGIEEVAGSDGRRRCFAYEAFSLVTSMKALALRHVLERGADAVLLLDSDLWVLGDLDALLSAVEAHDLTLTPHLLTPPPGGTPRAELVILRAGVYNTGCLGVRDSPGGRAVLAWWEERLSTTALYAPGEAVFYDQRWLDLAPGYVEDALILRDPAINVGFWNLAERSEADWRLFHFSGFDPAVPGTLSKKQRPPVPLEPGSRAAGLAADYATALNGAGAEETATWPYAFDHYEDGEPIPPAHRQAFRSLGERAGRFGDPFATSQGSFRAWLKDQPLG